MTSPQTNRSILVIDDDEIMRELLSAVFMLEGFAVETMSSGADGILAMQRPDSAFSIVLADLHMPALSGAALAERLRHVRTAPTILIGMSGSEPTEEERALFDAFLLKPFDISALLEAVAQSEVAMIAFGEPAALQAVANAAAPVVLDELVYSKLAAKLPAAQLGELYNFAMLDVERRIVAMQAAAARMDFAECRREAHAMKGSCGMTGAVELSTLAAQIEAGSFGGTPPFEEFTSAWSRLRGILNARFKTPN